MWLSVLDLYHEAIQRRHGTPQRNPLKELVVKSGCKD